MDNCIILVPLHPHKLADYEILSWMQLVKIYGYHEYCPICYVYPKCLGDIQTYIDEYNIPTHYYIYWPVDDYVFSSYENYNLYFGINETTYKFCLQNKFEWCLIYQLDAFVVRDEIQFWIDKGYDYYGGVDTLISGDLITYVYNGGFSLRNCQEILKILDDNPFQYGNLSIPTEDWYISQRCKNIIPGYEAIFFAVSSHFDFIQYALLGDKLAFGYHGLKSTNMYNFCKRIYDYQALEEGNIQTIDKL